MEHSDVQPSARVQERPLHPVSHAVDSAQLQAAVERARQARNQVDVVVVCESWWPTRQKQGVHVLNPSDSKLAHAKRVAWLAGTNTVYVYKELP